MTRPGTWKKGQSGNPNGRPPKGRALTELLEKAGSKTLVDIDGKRRSNKRIVARLAWEAVTSGKIELPSGSTLTLSPHDWLDFYKWIFAQIDGPPKQAHEVTGPDGDPVQFVIRGADPDKL